MTDRNERLCPRCGEPGDDAPTWETPGDGSVWHYLCHVKTAAERRAGEPVGSDRAWGPPLYDRSAVRK